MTADREPGPPARPSGTPAPRVDTERETPAGWVFWIDDDHAGRFELKLSFVDYDHWSGGSVKPAAVAEALASVAADEGVLDRLLSDGGRRFDAARLRRAVTDIDARLRERL